MIANSVDVAEDDEEADEVGHGGDRDCQLFFSGFGCWIRTADVMMNAGVTNRFIRLLRS